MQSSFGSLNFLSLNYLLRMNLKLIEINDDHWMYDYDAGLTTDEKVGRLADRLEDAGIDLAMVYYVAINTAFAGQPESIYVRAVLRTPSESVCDTFDIGEAFVSAEA